MIKLVNTFFVGCEDIIRCTRRPPKPVAIMPMTLVVLDHVIPTCSCLSSLAVNTGDD